MNVQKYVKKAKKQNKKALLYLILQQKDEYYRLAYAYLKNSHDAMDAMEEMILILYEKIQQLQKDEAFYSWSKTILVNICKNKQKKKNKEILLDTIEKSSKETINPYKNTAETLDINQLLETINPEQAEAIKLKYWHDLDNETIANITKVPLGTVKSRIFNGLAKLKSIYGGE